MSKERARRRAAREHEAAIRAAARAAEAERRERRAARGRALRRHTTDRLPRLGGVGGVGGIGGIGKDTGSLARRRRVETSLLLAGLAFVNLVVWVVRPDWGTRFAALVVTVLAAPVLHVLLLPRRR